MIDHASRAADTRVCRTGRDRGDARSVRRRLVLPTHPPRRRAVPTCSRPRRQGPPVFDKVTWNLQYEPSSIDYAKSFNYAENTAMANLCENLLRLKPDFTIKPSSRSRSRTPRRRRGSIRSVRALKIPRREDHQGR